MMFLPTSSHLLWIVLPLEKRRDGGLCHPFHVQAHHWKTFVIFCNKYGFPFSSLIRGKREQVDIANRKDNEMIKIRTANGDVKFMSNYQEVCHYINNRERRKASETGNIGWLFIRRGYETIANLYYRTSQLEKALFTLKEKEAIEKKVGIIEILKGSMENFTQILSKSNLDIEPLRRNWCYEYGKENGLEICELVERYI